MTSTYKYGIIYKVIHSIICWSIPRYSIKFHTQAYFGERRMLRTGFVFDEPLRTPTYSTKFHTQAYRSGHNEAVLKTVRGNSHGGSNPSACAKRSLNWTLVVWFRLFSCCGGIRRGIGVERTSCGRPRPRKTERVVRARIESLPLRQKVQFNPLGLDWTFSFGT